MMTKRLLTLALGLAMSGLVLAPVRAPAAALPTDREAVGFSIPTASGHAGGWIGSYRVSPGGPQVYCADPMKPGPSHAGGYGPAHRVSHWRTLGGRQVSPGALRRTGWILSSYGQARSKRRAAAVDTAVYALMSRGPYALGHARSQERLHDTGHGPAIRRLTEQFLAEAKRRSGPYRLHVGDTNVTDRGKVAATVRLTSARTGRPIAGHRVRVSFGGDRAASTTVRTDIHGTAHIAFDADRPGSYRLRATAGGLPTSSVWTVEPNDGRSQRMLVAGRNTSVSASDRVVVRAHPRVTTRTSREVVVPGAGLRDVVGVNGLAPGYHQTATAALYGPERRRADLRCTEQTLVRRVRFTVDGDGSYRTPAVTVHRPGRYTWVARLPGDRYDVGATHRCAMRPESSLVRKHPYSPPVVNAGYAVSGRARTTAARESAMSVDVPAAGIHARADRVAMAHGRMQLPSDVDRLGWLDRSARPGDLIGATVIGGHVSDRSDRPGAMWRLRDVQRGDVVRVHRGGQTIAYRVVRKDRYPRTRELPQRVFTTTGRHKVSLISCTHKVATGSGGFHYTDNIVVTARAVR